MKKAESAELKVSFINILSGRYWLLAIQTLNETLQLLFCRVFLQVGEDHLHLLTLYIFILGSKRRVAVALALVLIDYDRLCPHPHVLIRRVINVSVEVVGSAAEDAFLVKASQFFEQVAAQWSIFFRVEHLVVINRRPAYLGKIGPFIFERLGSSLQILL